MDPNTLMMLGQLLGQAGGVVGKAGGTPLGDAAAGVADVLGQYGKTRAQTQLMNQMIPGQPQVPGGQPQAPTSAGGTTMTPTAQVQPSGLAKSPAQAATLMDPGTLTQMVHDPKSNIAGATWSPDGKFTVSERKYDPAQLSELVGGGQSSSPFLEALLKMQ